MIQNIKYKILKWLEADTKITRKKLIAFALISQIPFIGGAIVTIYSLTYKGEKNENK